MVLLWRSLNWLPATLPTALCVKGTPATTTMSLRVSRYFVSSMQPVIRNLLSFQNVTNCKAKSPVFVSRPHFHLADPSYLDQFQFGLKPEKGAHDSSFWIEPESSIPVKVEMRLQLNIMLEKVEGIQYLFKNLQSVMFPVMWFDAVAILPENMAGSLNMLAMMPNVMLGCGLFSLILGMFLLFYFWKQNTLNEKQKLCRGEEKLRTECDYKIVNTRE